MKKRTETKNVACRTRSVRWICGRDQRSIVQDISLSAQQKKNIFNNVKGEEINPLEPLVIVDGRWYSSLFGFGLALCRFFSVRAHRAHRVPPSILCCGRDMSTYTASLSQQSELSSDFLKKKKTHSKLFVWRWRSAQIDVNLFFLRFRLINYEFIQILSIILHFITFRFNLFLALLLLLPFISRFSLFGFCIENQFPYSR